MGSAGDSPAPGRRPADRNCGEHPCKKDRVHWLGSWFPCRPARRRTEQAGRLCYPETIFKTGS